MSADYIPSSLIKSCPGVFSELIANLVNLSFSEGLFPTSFKQAVITPLLKKPSLDQSVTSNYRPISNLNSISKILERLFLTRTQSHILFSPNFNQYQSACQNNFSTETSLLFTTNIFFHSSDSGKSPLLISLDLIATFDAIDHSTLLNCLNTNFGFTQAALSGRYQLVHIGRHSSKPALCTSDVPQGSVLGHFCSPSTPHLFLALFSHLIFSNISTQMICYSSLLRLLLAFYPTSSTSHSVFLPYILGSALMVWLSIPISRMQLSLSLIHI